MVGLLRDVETQAVEPEGSRFDRVAVGHALGRVGVLLTGGPSGP